MLYAAILQKRHQLAALRQAFAGLVKAEVNYEFVNRAVEPCESEREV
jgi:hypothetical protein